MMPLPFDNPSNSGSVRGCLVGWIDSRWRI
jgi:hypothetical protein